MTSTDARTAATAQVSVPGGTYRHKGATYAWRPATTSGLRAGYVQGRCRNGCGTAFTWPRDILGGLRGSKCPLCGKPLYQTIHSTRCQWFALVPQEAA